MTIASARDVHGLQSQILSYSLQMHTKWFLSGTEITKQKQVTSVRIYDLWYSNSCETQLVPHKEDYDILDIKSTA